MRKLRFFLKNFYEYNLFCRYVHVYKTEKNPENWPFFVVTF